MRSINTDVSKSFYSGNQNIQFNLNFTSFNNEKEFVDTYNNARWFAKAQKNLWWFSHQVAYYSSRWKIGPFRKAANRKKDRMKRRSRNWGRTRAALDNIDQYWARAINAYRYETRTGTRTFYDAGKCGGPVHAPDIYKIDNIDLLISGDDDCDPWTHEYYTYTVQVPLKNDGLSAPQLALWNANDGLNSGSDNNFYYSDTGDGGYNHLELRRYKRQYKQGVNRKGDLAEPMLQTKNWLQSEVLR